MHSGTGSSQPNDELVPDPGLRGMPFMEGGIDVVSSWRAMWMDKNAERGRDFLAKKIQTQNLDPKR